MSVALSMSKRSSCSNRQVGAIVVDPKNRPISVGYNGAPAGYTAEPGDGCVSYCPRAQGQVRGSNYDSCVSVHAEANALLFADRREYSGGSIYVTSPCCMNCAKLVANSGVARVVVRLSEIDSHADIESPIELLKSCGLQVEIMRKEN